MCGVGVLHRWSDLADHIFQFAAGLWRVFQIAPRWALLRMPTIIGCCWHRIAGHSLGSSISLWSAVEVRLALVAFRGYLISGRRRGDAVFVRIALVVKERFDP
jgi:hypothetical protein